MLHVLVESRAPRARRGSFAAVSVVFHASLIAAAALLTARMEAPTRVERPEQLVYTAPAPDPALVASSPSSAPSSLDFVAPSIAVPQLSIATFAFPSTDIFARVLEDLGPTSI